MLTTFPGTHKMARCTVMRLADGRRLGGTAPSILRRAHAHRGPTASSKNATTPLACASVQSPQAQAGPRRGAERRSSIRCRRLRCEHPLPRSKRVQPSTNRSLKMRTVPCSVSVGTVSLAFSRPYCSIECQREAPETKMRDSNPGRECRKCQTLPLDQKEHTKCAPDKHDKNGV